MNADETWRLEKFSVEALRALRAAPAPRLSIWLPLTESGPQGGTNGLRMRDAIGAAREKLRRAGVAPPQLEEMLAPLEQLAGQLAATMGPAGGLAVFRSPGLLRCFRLDHPVSESVSVGPQFYIRPLLPLITQPEHFYILALSQKKLRLLRATERSCEEVPLPASIPRTLEQAGAFEPPDHQLANRSSAGSSAGDMAGVHFGTDALSERKNAYLYNFFKDVDGGLSAILRGERSPLLLAGVEHDTAIYRRVNSYPHLVQEDIPGSPDWEKDMDLHARALRILPSDLALRAERVLEQFERLAGIGRAVTDTQQVLKAVGLGRVFQLLLAEDAPAGTDDDPLNTASWETLMHGGQITFVPPGKMPDQKLMAAMLRY